MRLFALRHCQSQAWIKEEGNALSMSTWLYLPLSFCTVLHALEVCLRLSLTMHPSGFAAFLCVCVFAFPDVCVSLLGVLLSLCLAVFLCICLCPLSFCLCPLSFCLYLTLGFCPSVSVYLSLFLSISLSWLLSLSDVCLYLSVYICPSVSLLCLSLYDFLSVYLRTVGLYVTR